MICLSDFQYMQKDHKIAGFFLIFIYLFIKKCCCQLIISAGLFCLTVSNKQNLLFIISSAYCRFDQTIYGASVTK